MEPGDRIFEDNLTLPELIFQALGAASMCWENVAAAGVFDDKWAKAIGDELLQRLSVVDGGGP